MISQPNVIKKVYNFKEILAFRLQRQCLYCDGIQNSSLFGLCHKCKLALTNKNNRCQQCAISLNSNTILCGQCISGKNPINTSYCAGDYQQLGKSIYPIKQCDLSHIRLACQLLKAQLPMNLKIDAIVSVPMFYRHWLQKGNNHSDLLAKQLSHMLDIPYLSKALKQIKPNQEQKGLSLKERKQNVRNIYQVTQDIHNMNIAIIDDVMTTSATAQEIARVLKQQGAKTVQAWIIARREGTKHSLHKKPSKLK